MSRLEAADEPQAPSRRRWLAAALGTMTLGYLGAVLYPIYRYLVTGGTQDAGSVTEVALGPASAVPPGSGRVFRFGNVPGILIRGADGTFTAFNATCTHLGCTVEYQQARGIIWCPCHGGQYDPRTGAVLAGPPPRPLASLQVAERAGALFVSQGEPTA